MLIVVYSSDELDKIQDWMDSIEDGNKEMLALYGNIQEIWGRAKAQILEVDKYYSMASMKIFIDDSKDEFTSAKFVIQ